MLRQTTHWRQVTRASAPERYARNGDPSQLVLDIAGVQEDREGREKKARGVGECAKRTAQELTAYSRKNDDKLAKKSDRCLALTTACLLQAKRRLTIEKAALAVVRGSLAVLDTDTYYI